MQLPNQLMLKELEKKYSVSIKTGTMRYTNNDFSFKVTADLKDPAKSDVENDKAQFIANCWKFNAKPEWFGKSFTDARGFEFKVIGINPRKRKKAFIIQRKDNKQNYITTSQSLAIHL